MTQAFCHLVMHYAVARLSWKTIKSLRRSRSRHKKCSDGDNNGSTMASKNDEDVSTVEYEILQGWTIIAFHSLYVSMGVEYFVRFVIPFYFHLKMIVLIATFVVPSWTGMNGGGDGRSEFGLSPVVSYWFDYLIVPGVTRVHEFMDHDPKGWAMHQLAMMPFLIIDFFILPGILTTDEEKQLVRKRRREGIMGEGDTAKVPPNEVFPQSTANANLSSDELSDQSKMSNEQIISRDKKVDPKSATKDADNFRKVSYIEDSFARKHDRKQIAEEKGLDTQQPDENKSIHRTPPRHQKQSALFNESTPNRTHTSPRTTPNRASKKTSSLTLSPAVKSRLTSSAMKLREFARGHQRNGGMLSPNTTPRRGKENLDADGADDNVSKSEATIKRIMESPEKWPNESKLQSASKTRRKRRERLSLGDHFRELVTGDANIRVRDHLFDLDLPSSSSPHQQRRAHPDKEGLLEEFPKRHGSRNGNGRRRNTSKIDMDGQKEMGASTVTTRRSSRLAKKKSSGH